MSLEEKLRKIEHFDSLIFSLLTRQKNIFVGVGNMSEEFYKFIQEFLPEELKENLSYSPNDKSLEDTSVISGFQMNEESMKILDKAQGRYTVVFLPANEVYGQYTSPFCKKAATLLKQDKIASLKEELSIFYKKAVESEEIVPPADFMVQHSINKADASLIMWIRAQHFGKEINNSLFIDMDW